MMIQEFIDKFMQKKPELEHWLAEKHPTGYEDIVQRVVTMVRDPDDYESIDPDRIHIIDDGEYQGTLVFVIGASGYQPDRYWYVKVSYGSCSVCDTFGGIREYSDGPPTEQQIKDYTSLALHIVQGLREM